MKHRIIIAGHEIGGQMQLLAEGFRRKGFNARAVAFNSDFRNYKNDHQIKNRKIPLQRFIFALIAIFRYDVFHFFWGVSLFDFWRFHGLDLPLLKLMNKKVVVHFRGTDIVNVKYYHYLLAQAQGVNGLKLPANSRPDQVKKIKMWKKYADIILVSTPDLLSLTGPDATLIPQVIDFQALKNMAKPKEHNELIRIAHAPTRRVAKGTEILIEAVAELSQRGYRVQLDLVENLPPSKVIEIFAQSDLGVDQLLFGWYGKVSVELMALGKPVLCYIDKELLKYRPDLPIVNVTPATLTDELERLILDKNLRETIGLQSQRYAAAHHDVARIVDELLMLYGFEGKPA